MEGVIEKTSRAQYTLKYKLEAVRLIGSEQRISATAAILGLAQARRSALIAVLR